MLHFVSLISTTNPAATYFTWYGLSLAPLLPESRVKPIRLTSAIIALGLVNAISRAGLSAKAVLADPLHYGMSTSRQDNVTWPRTKWGDHVIGGPDSDGSA